MCRNSIGFYLLCGRFCANSIDGWRYFTNAFKELAKKLLNLIPNQYRFVRFACDRYDAENIKCRTRFERRIATIQQTEAGHENSGFVQILENGSNKYALLEITEQVIQQGRVSLGNRVVYISRKTTCVRISNSSFESIPQLETDHMEADTMLSYLIAHSFEMISVLWFDQQVVILTYRSYCFPT